jgi:hypothetical protein
MQIEWREFTNEVIWRLPNLNVRPMGDGNVPDFTVT